MESSRRDDRGQPALQLRAAEFLPLPGRLLRRRRLRHPLGAGFPGGAALRCRLPGLLARASEGHLRLPRETRGTTAEVNRAPFLFSSRSGAHLQVPCSTLSYVYVFKNGIVKFALLSKFASEIKILVYFQTAEGFNCTACIQYLEFSLIDWVARITVWI